MEPMAILRWALRAARSLAVGASSATRRTWIFACAALGATAVVAALASAQTGSTAQGGSGSGASESRDQLRYAQLSDREAWAVAKRFLPRDPTAVPLDARPVASAAAAGSSAAKAAKGKGRAATKGAPPERVEYLRYAGSGDEERKLGA